MSAAKRRTKKSFGLLTGLAHLFRGNAPLILAAAGLLIAVGSLLAYAWNRWGPAVIDDPRYQVTADILEVTPPPAWIRSDVKAEVMRDGSLQALSLLDTHATVTIARAFDAHSWVARVHRVSKQSPPRVIVELEYRRPIAMVEAISGGFWPVDTEGYLLPPEEFSPSQTRDYLRIIAENSQPAGPVGTLYGDPRVVGAAAIATLLEDDWKPLGIHRLLAHNRSPSGQRLIEPEFELVTRQGVRVMWGRAPGEEKSGELLAEKKRERLIEYIAVHGPLDENPGASRLDLRGIEPPPTVRPASSAADAFP